MILFTNNVNATWFDENLLMKAPITVNTNGTINDYALSLWLPYDSNMLPTYDDLRFTNASENQALPHWIETYNTTGVKVWVKGNWGVANGTQAYVYYNNATPITTTSNGNTTFVFFDNFAGTSLDSTKWIQNVNPPTINNGLTLPAGTQTGIHSAIIFSEPNILEYFGTLNTGAWAGGFIGFTQSNGYPDGDPDTGVALWTVHPACGTSGPQCFEVTGTKTSASFSGVNLIKQIWFQDGSASFTSNGTLLATITATKELGNYPLTIQNGWAGANTAMTYSWIRVRNYTAVEPTYSFGSEESQAITLTPITVKQWIEVSWYNNTHINYTVNVWVYNNATTISSKIYVNFTSLNFSNYTIASLNADAENTSSFTNIFVRPTSDNWFNQSGVNISSGGVNGATGLSNIIKMILPIDPPSAIVLKSGGCIWSTGNWNINCSKNCNIVTNTDVGSNNIIFSGAGSVVINAILKAGNMIVDPACQLVKPINNKEVVW